MLISIAEHRYIDPSDISFVAGLDTISSETSQLYLKKLKERGQLLDITNKQKPRTIILTKQGSAILTSLQAKTLMYRLENKDEISEV